MHKTVSWIVAALVAIALPSAWAQDARPLRVIVGFQPGGSLDQFARLLANEMAGGIGRPVIVENRPGADGNIAADQVAKAAPDGLTMLATFNTHPLLSALYPHLPFDPLADFRAVGFIATTPYLLVARPDLPGRRLAEVLDKARAEGRVLSFATVGAGSPQHLSAERLRASTTVPITIVHYKGGAPALTDVMGGHVDIMLVTVALGLQPVKAGKLKLLAVSSERRLASLPDVPTIAEQGFEGFVSEGWYGFLLPARTAPEIVRRYNDELNRALRSQRVREGLDSGGAAAYPSTPEQMEQRMREEQRVWAKVVRDAGIKIE